MIDVLTPADLIEMAQDLWSFLGTVMTDDIHPRRESLAAGEDGNGFELWRVLFWEHEGGAQQVHVHGIRDFHTFPQCKSMQDLAAHIGEWQKSRARYASTLPI